MNTFRLPLTSSPENETCRVSGICRTDTGNSKQNESLLRSTQDVFIIIKKIPRTWGGLGTPNTQGETIINCNPCLPFNQVTAVPSAVLYRLTWRWELPPCGHKVLLHVEGRDSTLSSLESWTLQDRKGTLAFSSSDSPKPCGRRSPAHQLTESQPHWEELPCGKLASCSVLSAWGCWQLGCFQFIRKPISLNIEAESITNIPRPSQALWTSTHYLSWSTLSLSLSGHDLHLFSVTNIPHGFALADLQILS